MGGSLVKSDWQRQHVYLVQYPRCRTIPNLSPWSLKLETWLRMAGIPFTNINNDFTKFSAKGQVPFVEVNGRQIGDSNFIIETVKEEFKVDMEPADALGQSHTRAYSALAEEHLTWVMFAIRGKTGYPFLFSDDGWGRYFGTGLRRFFTQLVHKIGIWKLVTCRANAQGMGRHSLDELYDIAKEDLKAISAFLGDKQYFEGDRPTTLDATMFGHLAGLVYMSAPNDILLNSVKDTYPNLGQFVERIKENMLKNQENLQGPRTGQTGRKHAARWT
ncbi:hypothetical protein PRIPAC_81352 [Pristionchus pacificus]|nr:hypothetical protein PRIPAC_81352 [Pristionchus pacificus]